MRIGAFKTDIIRFIYMNDEKIYIGIDPGTNGGIAVLDYGGKVLSVVKMPATPQDILDFLGEYSGQDIKAALEDVGHGIPGQSSKATATFARHNGHLDAHREGHAAEMAEGVPARKQQVLHQDPVEEQAQGKGAAAFPKPRQEDNAVHVGCAPNSRVREKIGIVI